jgi:hypothetical protein
VLEEAGLLIAGDSSVEVGCGLVLRFSNAVNEGGADCAAEVGGGGGFVERKALWCVCDWRGIDEGLDETGTSNGVE